MPSELRRVDLALGGSKRGRAPLAAVWSGPRAAVWCAGGHRLRRLLVWVTCWPLAAASRSSMSMVQHRLGGLLGHRPSRHYDSLLRLPHMRRALPPPGWYPDPRGTGSWWWWDGWQWIVPPASQPPERMTPASQPPEPMTPFKVVDVPGSRHRRVAGPSAFEETIKALPLGPLHVTLRFQPNEVNPYAIGAYVDEVQVGLAANGVGRPPTRMSRG